MYAGTNGDTVRTLASSNLVDWTAISTNTVPSTNLFDIFDTTSQARRFYRVALPEPPESVYIAAASGIVDAPFLITNTGIYQPIQTEGVTKCNARTARNRCVLHTLQK
jgi:hypothetical protein